MKIQLETTIDHHELGEVDVSIVAYVWPGDPGKLTGPPESCCPPEPPDVEIIEAAKITRGQHKGTTIYLTEDQQDALFDDAIEAAADHEEGLQDAAAERQYEEWKDRQLEKRRQS